MTTDHHQASSHAGESDESGAPSESLGYARLAKRISAITTNCLLTAIVLIAGLGFGRQVLKWWAGDGEEPVAASRAAQGTDGLGDPARLHVLQFGDQTWSLRRQSIFGDKRAAAIALRANCREVVRQGGWPTDRPPKSERELLSRLAASEPVEQESAAWRLYELDEAFPMVVGTRRPADEADRPASKRVSATADRIVTWGLAIPDGADAWTVCTFQPESSSGEKAGGLSEIPLPPECSRTLAMRVAGGGAILAFEGPPRPKRWIEFYNDWFSTHNWKAAGSWQHLGSGWHGRFSTPGSGPAGSVDVHFGTGGRGRSIGLIMTAPSPRRKGPKEGGDP